MDKKKKVTKKNSVKKTPAKKSSSTSKNATPKRSTTRTTQSKKTTSKVNKVVSKEPVKEESVVLEEKVIKKSKVDFKKYLTKRNIIIMSIILIIVILLCIFLFKGNKNSMSYYINDNSLNLNTKLNFKTDTSYKVASKYGLKNDKVYISEKEVMLNDLSGKMVYVRGSELKANIYQSYIYANKKIEGVPTLIILSQYMESFENDVLNEMKIPNDIEMVENYFGMRKFKFKLTPEESILKEGREYSKSFKYKSVKYEFNYYINDDNLVCEFVRFL